MIEFDINRKMKAKTDFKVNEGYEKSGNTNFSLYILFQFAGVNNLVQM